MTNSVTSKKCVCSSVVGFLGLVFLVAGCVLIKVFGDLIHDEVKNGIPLKKGSDSYKLWQAPTSPIYFQVWFFDIVNHMEVLNGGKPSLVQKGPYTYREKREKFNITYNDNGTLFYRESRTFFFDRALSVGPETDTFTAVNLPYVTITDILRREKKALKELVNLAFKVAGETLFINLTVGGLLWGYEDPLLKTVVKIAKDFNVNLTLSDKFGLFYNQNGTDDGIYEIYSGIKGVDNFAQIASWNGQTKLNYWTADLANMINGSDGTMYPPFINTSSTKYLFSSDLCRSLGVTYKQKVTVRGIDLEQFVAPDIMFGNVSVNPYNKGFCTPPGNCLPSGLLNVSVCRQGAPVIMSMPHFLGCDSETLNAVSGLHPSREAHQSYMDMEPMTGVVMNVGKRLQINSYVEKIDGFWDTYNIKPIVMPVMWLNESAMISAKDASKFKTEVLDKVTITEAVQYGLIALGSFMILFVIVLAIKRKACPAEKPLGHIDDDALLIPAA